MKKELTLGESKILISKEEDGMGIYFSGPFPDDPYLEFYEAYDLLDNLIEYLMFDNPKKEINNTQEHVLLPYLKMTPLPKETPSWIVTETPWIWKGQVIVSLDSLRYYEDLRRNLLNKAGKETSELIQIFVEVS